MRETQLCCVEGKGGQLEEGTRERLHSTEMQYLRADKCITDLHHMKILGTYENTRSTK